MAHRIATVASVTTLIALAGCGGGLFAPEGPASNAFLNKVDTACGRLTIGTQPMDYLLSVENNDTTFIDLTAKLGTGEIGADTYRQGINTAYPAGDNGPAIDCVINQLE
ncbi:MAG: hypothetical protein LJE69_12935 [Thiohalocapsa sp.]|uniref:hypothetical protein n=1 Tax=Thiohalocapsa sp. TaxID=2497641 RepID=UPI0025DD3F46|nr:hypothetical protein [Thiohalocapsa sp.]MCG6942142.1 hypothetical protein [Thiohalocapsa sp.]